MRRLTICSICVLAAVATALAANVHFKSQKAPRLKDNGLTATISGCLAGLGNQDVLITVSAQGVGSATCRNRGGNEAPGQNKVPLSLEGTQTISAEEVKNGNVCFNVTTAGPPEVSAREAGCPNGNWTAQVADVQFIGFTVTVEQGGQTVLTFSQEL